MCNRKPVSIKAVSVYAPKALYIPCGECFECRGVQRSSWTFRLRAELEPLVKRGWWLGFVTLTYRDECLPHMPRVLLKGLSKVDEMPMCFSKDDCRAFIDALRQWLKRKYQAVKKYRYIKNKEKVISKKLVYDDALRYMLCSEFGEHTARSHYHMLLALPSRIPPDDVFNKIHELWSFGFVFPKNFTGGFDSHGYEHKPFVVDSVGSACAYCAKYVCKDLAWLSKINLKDYKKNVVIEPNTLCQNAEPLTIRLSDYVPFHMQSKSLGLSFIKDLDDSTKLRYLKDGCSFVGVDTLLHLPVYLRNKLIFDNYYIVDADGNRLCRRSANAFLEKYKNEIFDSKVEFISRKVEQWRKMRFNKSVDRALLSRISCYSARLIALSSSELARFFVAYGGVNPSWCYDIDPVDFWLARYQCCDNGVYCVEVDFSEQKKVDPVFLENLNSYFSLCYQAENQNNDVPLKLALDHERELQYFIDLFKSCE